MKVARSRLSYGTSGTGSGVNRTLAYETEFFGGGPTALPRAAQVHPER